jgi:hypothetical protein
MQQQRHREESNGGAIWKSENGAAQTALTRYNRKRAGRTQWRQKAGAAQLLMLFVKAFLAQQL